jgi:trans-aconitate 2-methyltransferase
LTAPRVTVTRERDSGLRLLPSDSMNWSAAQYVAFEDERTRPARDLLAALPPLEAHSVVDLGCGPGNSTELLAARFPGARVSGIDSSSDMIAAARKRLPALRFELGEIERWLGEGSGPFDVILANAVLQWLPDHPRLLPAILSKLANGGALAVQMPDNLGEPAHHLMREIAAAGPWAGKLAPAGTQRASIRGPSEYFELLCSSCRHVDVWRTTYYHVLRGGAAAIVEWFMGSSLRPFIAPLDGAERAEFLALYQSEVARAYPAMTNGSVLLPFPRLFIIAIQ